MVSNEASCPLLLAWTREDSTAILLENDQTDDYRTPPLPFGEMSPTIQGCLRRLKAPQTAMVLGLWRMMQTPSLPQYGHLGLLYTLERKHFDLQYHEQGQKWVDSGFAEAATVSGIVCHHVEGAIHYCSLDTLPFATASQCLKNDTADVLAPILEAAARYNREVAMLHSLGVFLLPAYFVHGATEAYPHLSLKKKVVKF